jgi:hypothetical protein
MPDRRPDDDDFGTFWVRIRPLASPRGIRSTLRVRAMLKTMLRSYHLRVEKLTCEGPDGVMVELPPDDAADANVAKPGTAPAGSATRLLPVEANGDDSPVLRSPTET